MVIARAPRKKKKRPQTVIICSRDFTHDERAFSLCLFLFSHFRILAASMYHRNRGMIVKYVIVS